MNIRIVRRSGNGGSGSIIFGSILATLFTVSAVALVLSEEQDSLLPLIVCVLLAFLGIHLIVRGIRKNRRNSSFSGNVHEFDPDTPEFVQDRIRQLMQEGTSSSVTVSRTTKRVTYRNSDGSSHTTETTTETHNGTTPFQPASQPGTVTCQACGGIAKLRRGENGICEYCGSHIRG